MRIEDWVLGWFNIKELGRRVGKGDLRRNISEEWGKLSEFGCGS